MASPKLTREQREVLLTWLAADYDWRLIVDWFKEREWPAITWEAAHYYRKRFAKQLDERRSQRHSDALNKGLALKEERVARLKAHADELEKIKWTAGDKGRLWNEKAWRETLADIAAEMGHRKQSVDLTSGGEPLTVKVLRGVSVDDL